MPPRGRNTTLPSGNNHTGWYRDGVNGILEWYTSGTKVGQASGTTVTYVGTTAATAITASTGNVTATLGDIAALAGNLKLNSPGAFSSTQPVGAAIFMVGTAPAGTITTGGGIFTDGTTMKKIIAANTVSDIQT